MNLAIQELPSQCDVLVVGAGPAGSAAALTLAQAGFDVVLIDQHAFPRDKVCGDGLIPDAHHALRKLGVLDEVMARAQAVGMARCNGPRGGFIDIPGTLAVLPRKELDMILCRAAAAAGARMFAPVQFKGPLEEQMKSGEVRVVGAHLLRGETARVLRARWTVLASGARPQALIASGMSTRTGPSGIALRGYFRNPTMAGRIDKLELVWNRAIANGYGWIFPCPDGVFNIGVGTFENTGGARDNGAAGRAMNTNLHRLMEEFIRIHAPARELLAGGTPLGPWKGAPLRCTLEGAKHVRPGLLVAGEAAGSTYLVSGEGIGKAMETGILAAEALHTMGSDDNVIQARYEAGLRALQARFDMYRRASTIDRHPWLIDLLIWRAKKNPGLLKRLSGVLNETSSPGNLLSLHGLRRLLLSN
ncbi:MAG: geranylgeranyl reductase family protein [Pseudomonadota bacterium]